MTEVLKPPKLIERDLITGEEKPVRPEDLPELGQKQVKGSQKAGCHSFTYQKPDGKLGTIIWKKD